MLIVSVAGRLVRDPATARVVDEVGIDIDPTDPYWARLLTDGDVADASAVTPIGKSPATEDAVAAVAAPSPKSARIAPAQEA